MSNSLTEFWYTYLTQEEIPGGDVAPQVRLIELLVLCQQKQVEDSIIQWIRVLMLDISHTQEQWCDEGNGSRISHYHPCKEYRKQIYEILGKKDGLQELCTQKKQ